MKHSKPLLEGKLLNRYKRFFADVEHEGEKYTIHVPNTGSLKSVIEKSPNESQLVWFSLHGDKSKKLAGTLEAVRTPRGTWVGVNTSNPNRIVTEAIEESIKNGKAFLPQWNGYGFYKSEYKINKETRLDGAFFQTKEDFEKVKASSKTEVPIHFIEIKNTTYLPEGDVVQFPDAVTERGQKHLLEMMKLMEQGHKCEIIYTVQRSDAQFFSPAEVMDPKYADLFYKAVDQGLIVSPLVVALSQNEISLSSRILKIKKG